MAKRERIWLSGILLKCWEGYLMNNCPICEKPLKKGLKTCGDKRCTSRLKSRNATRAKREGRIKGIGYGRGHE